MRILTADSHSAPFHLSHILFILRVHLAFSGQRDPQEVPAGFSPQPHPPLHPHCFDVVKQPLIIDWDPDLS